jgi:DNA-binding response OmpR family regulator
MKKILIIEDEKALLDILSDKLEREGFDVSGAGDGEEGLEKMRQEKPDLILLDIIMPKIGGMEVLEVMHGDGQLKNIPVIIISNSGQPVEIEKAKGLGARDFLIKADFDPKEVVDKVHNMLEGEAPGNNHIVPEMDLGKQKEARPAKGTAHQKAGKHTVLVVEDDQFLRDLIVKKLEEEDFITIQAIDGEEGLRLIREKNPDIVLLDLILPGIDGFEVLKQSKADASIANVPIIILSNLGQKDDIDRGLQLGAKDYLIKAHFTPGEIVQKVKDILK